MSDGQDETLSALILHLSSTSRIKAAAIVSTISHDLIYRAKNTKMQLCQILAIIMSATVVFAKPNPATKQVIKVPRCKRAYWLENGTQRKSLYRSYTGRRYARFATQRRFSRQLCY